MDETDTDSRDTRNRVRALFANVVEGGGEANGAIPHGGGARLEHDADSARFRRYESQRKASVKRKEQKGMNPNPIEAAIKLADGAVFVGKFHGYALELASNAGYSDDALNNAELGFSHADGSAFYEAATLGSSPRPDRARGRALLAHYAAVARA